MLDNLKALIEFTTTIICLITAIISYSIIKAEIKKNKEG